MCVDIFCMCYFSHVLVRYIDVLLFRQFFDCKIVFKFALIQNLKSLSSVLSQSLYLYVFLSRMAFHTFIFHRKESMEISCYILYFSLKIFDFLTCIIFVIYIQHQHLVRTENAQMIDLQQTKPGCQQTTVSVAIFRICVTLNIL